MGREIDYSERFYTDSSEYKVSCKSCQESSPFYLKYFDELSGDIEIECSNCGHKFTGNINALEGQGIEYFQKENGSIYIKNC